MRFRSKWTPVPIKHPREAKPVRIVGDGAIAGRAVADGKLVPVLILDTTHRPDIEELVRIHEHLPPGDAISQWCKLKDTHNAIALVLSFVRPSEVIVALNFDLALHGGLVDLILVSKALYLQPGKDGDRLSTTMTNSRIIVEVPETGFREHWEQMKYDSLVKDFRGRGLSKRQAKHAAAEFIDVFARFIDFRWK